VRAGGSSRRDSASIVQPPSLLVLFLLHGWLRSAFPMLVGRTGDAANQPGRIRTILADRKLRLIWSQATKPRYMSSESVPSAKHVQ
jgi:hypothetical protein